MRILIAAVLCLSFAVLLPAQGPVGTWKTIDDDTGEAKSYVEIYKQGNELYGKVVRLLKSSPDRKCDKCSGERKDKPILQMVILENMQIKEGYWQSGRILDPEKGKWYTCNFWLKDGDPNVLVVRGYIGPFYRTQYWYRIKNQ
ncbi:MAG: DUF2147 domain-containing protein [Bacteroidetes bacterium]|nr:MAG: DUF2147 domain-containing protein [Bacteroidota bacterium]